ncbi:MAG: NAD(P)/FAD-dependent oxidoreductase [Planctomycetota bacterium]|jgi:predicted NAD/FAD-binding protein
MIRINENPRQRIAIVGSGISGLVAAHLLHPDHEITVFEANDYVGGHTNTVDVDLGGERYAVDTGFIVFNKVNYPNFVRLLGQLGVESQPSTMSFSVRSDRTGLEYNGSSVNRLFVQRRNLLRPRFHAMIRDILRFNREAGEVLAAADLTTTVAEYVAERGYGDAFTDEYLVPMGSSIWSCPPATFRGFPIRFVVDFFNNHAMLRVNGRPQWRVITGGSKQYVRSLIRPFRDRIRLSTPVRSVRRLPDRVEVETAARGCTHFDHVIFACHSDQALRLLGDASILEHDVLGAFPYQRNDAVLHTDASVLPRRRRAWAAWNYHIRAEDRDAVAVTYNMNILQTLRSRHTFCVTLNDDEGIDPGAVVDRFVYEHPVFTAGRVEAQARHEELIDVNRTSYCGAYWGYGFHEDGVNSALAVCRAFGKELEP